MATSILFGGQNQYRPGVYLRVIDATTAPTSLQAGNIALIGEFPLLEQAKMHTFAQVDTMREFFFPVGENRATLTDDGLKTMQRIAAMVWADLAVPTDLGTIDSINIISVSASDAASYTENGLKISSKFHGNIGNSLKVKLEADPDDATKWQLSVLNGGVLLEKFSGIGDEDPSTIKFENSGVAPSTGALSGATVQVSASAITDEDGDGVVGSDGDFRTGGEIIVRGQQTVLAATIDAATAVAIWRPRSLQMGGGTVSLTQVAAQSSSFTFTVNGTSPSGASQEEELVFTSTDLAGASKTTTKVFKSLTSIEVAAGSGWTGNLTVNFPIKSSPLNDVGSVGDFLLGLVALDDRFTVDPSQLPVSGDMLDQRDATSVFSTTVKLTTDLYRIYSRALMTSQFTKTTLLSNEMPSTFDEFLSGGAITDDPDATDWQSALDSLLYENINIVVPFTNTFELHELVKAHCTRAATESGLERNAWIGTEPGLSLQNVNLQWTKLLNDPNIAVVFQGIQSSEQINGGSGVAAVILSEPYWTALAMATMQARTPISEPLTRKRLSNKVVRLFSGSVDINAQANEAIRKGIVLLNGARAPFRVERSITSFLSQPDHPVYGEVSAVESINVSVRDVRQFLEEVIGGKATVEKMGDVKKIVENRLSLQRDRKIIEAFADVSVSMVGDRINVSYSVQAQKPLNFIVVSTYLRG